MLQDLLCDAKLCSGQPPHPLALGEQLGDRGLLFLNGVPQWFNIFPFLSLITQASYQSRIFSLKTQL
jgi:hypothetical protein